MQTGRGQLDWYQLQVLFLALTEKYSFPFTFSNSAPDNAIQGSIEYYRLHCHSQKEFLFNVMPSAPLRWLECAPKTLNTPESAKVTTTLSWWGMRGKQILPAAAFRGKWLYAYKDNKDELRISTFSCCPRARKFPYQVGYPTVFIFSFYLCIAQQFGKLSLCFSVALLLYY